MKWKFGDEEGRKKVKARLELLPAKYHRMFMAYVNDPPAKNSELDQALDLFFMTHQYFGGGAWSEETLGRSLAWAMLAGFPECCVFTPMRVVILVASYRYCIRGGCVPDVAAMREAFIPAAQELCKYQDKTPWLPALMARYKITGWEKTPLREWTDKSQKNFFGLRKLFRFIPKERK